MTSEQCSRCRFWLLERADPEDNRDESFGWCRRFPPVVVDHMARQAIPTVGFGGHNFDPENIATVMNVHNAGLFPASYADEWCGEYAAAREA
jgi:hypothetical protein